MSEAFIMAVGVLGMVAVSFSLLMLWAENARMYRRINEPEARAEGLEQDVDELRGKERGGK